VNGHRSRGSRPRLDGAPFGEFNPWQPRKLASPTAPELARGGNDQAGRENARYESWQYALGNRHSTSQTYAGMTSSGNPARDNPMAWNPYLARQVGNAPSPGPMSAAESAAARHAWQRPADRALVRPDGTLTEAAFSDEEYRRLTGRYPGEVIDTPWPADYEQRYPVVDWNPWYPDPRDRGIVNRDWLPYWRKNRPVW
jgi:hypothetical protein